VQTFQLSWAGQKVLALLRSDLFKHLHRLSQSYYDQNEAGAVMSRITNDVGVINDMLSVGLLTIAGNVVTLIGVVVFMLLMDVKLSLLTFTVLPVMVVATVLFTQRAKAVYRETRSKIGLVNAALEEGISGVRVVQSFSREDANVAHFRQINNENRQVNINAAILSSMYGPVADVLGVVALGIVLWFGAYLVVGGSATVGVVVAFAAYVQKFFQPIRDLSQVYNTFQAAMAGGERIFELLDTEPDIVDAPDALPMGPILGHVQFEHVNFNYLPDQPVLRDVSLDAPAGSTIAIVGPTGAGKSTIATLIGRNYDVNSGRVLVDGHDVRDVQIATLRRQIGVVLQDTFLFSGTIRDNIRYGRLDATDAEVEAAAQAVNAHVFIAKLPAGYATPIAERGQNLSLGQRQLISFARALLADPRILILDEATSSVDAATEVLIQQALTRLLQSRTSFVIAHRLSTIRNATEVLVVDHGEIVERGTHQQLLALEGVYYQLYTTQFRRRDERQREALEAR
jgi:ABC-type multidrug transport system fused ATPase/permease subunit